ncbi:diguanylate cyclase [Cohnella massiliensis]|uniref:diguanylate cyclase n=1 Tax=Cohnella massiliensis TaxID=1816691 RepID=UPI0009B934D2|nr:diguanylate cyclase [Cohnella massiliensis]
MANHDGNRGITRYIQANVLPSLTPSELPTWVQRQDLSEADLPYIQALLTESFADWNEQAEQFPWLAGCSIVLLHPDGTKAACKGEPDGDNRLPANWKTERIGMTAAGSALQTCRPALTRGDEHEFEAFRFFDMMAAPMFTRSSGLLCGVLVGLMPAGQAQAGELKLLQAAALHLRSCLYRRFELMLLGDHLHSTELVRREERRSTLLFEAMRKLNDHIYVEDVLSEVLGILDQVYPFCCADLFLSQDYSSMNEKVKPLAFHQQEMDLCWKAFMDGEIREEFQGTNRRIAFPLAGKQGVYGVMLLEMRGKPFDEADLRFVTMLTGVAGTAFEKAKLHEQANTLVGELRLINELTQRLNSSLKLKDTMTFATDALLDMFKADYCFILQLDSFKAQFTVIASNVPEMTTEVFAADYGFCGVMLSTKEPIILSDYHNATPVHSRIMDETISRSLLASPLIINGEVIGAVLVTHRLPNHFSYDNYKLLQVLAAHLGLAVSNATMHAEMRRMVITDNLTGLFARHYLNERIQRRQLRDGSGSLILVDIDHFKKINDTFGHQVGDVILMQVSSIVQSAIRDSDIAARWGGEELAIYLPQLGLEQTKRIAERIRRRVEEETDPKVTVSCGVSQWTTADERVSVESLFYRADMALYDAKHSGRNNVAVG